MNLKLDRIIILIVEDILPMRNLLVHMLETMGAGRVYSATDGQSGFDVFCNKNPDIVITDWNMPQLDGIELTKKIRNSDQSPNKLTPIMMMSGYCSLKRISEARDSGVTEYIAKPFSAHDLSIRLAYMIKNPRDFIVAKDYSGPTRRRQKKAGFEKNNKRKVSRKDLIEHIQADISLGRKAGLGKINETAVSRGQKILDENQVNFIPIAEAFLEQLTNAIKLARNSKLSDKAIKDELTTPIMQIKANATIFHYELAGDMANIVLNFIESLDSVDSNALDILNAHVITLKKIITGNLRESYDQTGQKFKQELEDACNRYKKLRASELQRQDQKEIDK